MAFSDLCHISNAYKTVENEADQSDRIMEENSMVRDLITKILDETGPSESCSSLPPPEKALTGLPPSPQYLKNETPNTFMPSMFNNTYQNNNIFNNYSQDNGFNNFSMPNSFGQNGFSVDNDVPLLNLDDINVTDTVSAEQLNLLRLAAQEIGGAQFTNPNNDKFYNFFEPNQINSLPDTNMYSVNYNRPNSLNLDLNFNSSFEYNQRFPNKYDSNLMKDSQDPSDIISYLSNLNLNSDRPREEPMPNTMDFKMPEVNGHFQNDDYSKLLEDRNKMYYNRNYQPPPKNFNNEFYLNDVMSQMNDRNHVNQFDFNNAPIQNSMAYKPNGYQQNEFIRNQIMHRDYPMTDMKNYPNYDARDNQQAFMMRQNQEIARQMSMLMRNRPPPHQLNVDVSFLHENGPFNLGLGALLGPSPPVPPPVLPSPMLDLPLMAPFYAMRNMRATATSSSILHARLDACYEQWRQLERERKRTEARLALAFPGRCVSSSNSIPVPRLPPAPTRVDRLTVDMLREHTKVLTLMGKMETLRASVCVAQNKKPHQKEDSKITVLKRGQENIANEKEKDCSDPEKFDPASWKEDVKNLTEIAPHSEIEKAMLCWRAAVAGVQAARRKELTSPSSLSNTDPLVGLALAVKQLCAAARRARGAVWSDLTLTVALAPPPPPPPPPPHQTETTANAPSTKQDNFSPNAKFSNDSKDKDKKEENTSNDPTPPKDTKQDTNNKTSKDKNQQRRSQNYRKVNNGRSDFYQKRYDNRFMNNRNPYYLATGPIN